MYFSRWLALAASSLLLVQTSFGGKDPEIIVLTWMETVQVKPGSGAFTNTISVSGSVPDGAGAFVIPYTSLEPIDRIEGTYLDDRGRSIRIKKDDLRDGALLTTSFYDDLRARYVDLPRTSSFQLEWTTRCEMPMMLTSIRPATDPQPLVWNAEIHVPRDQKLIVDLPPADHRSVTMRVDSSSSTEIVHHFQRDLEVARETGQLDQGLQKDISDGFVRLLLLPVERSSAPYAAFRDWYLDLVRPVQELDLPAQEWLTGLVQGAATDEEKIDRVFRAVRTQVNYIAIEDAINGFRPRAPGQVWTQRKGDCKDVANLLSCGLRYLGLDACLALSSTIAHARDLDLPTLSSADHVICAVHLPGGWLYLDATESECPMGWPSRQIQDRHVLLMDGTVKEPQFVPALPADSNAVDTKMEVTLDGNKCHGTYGSTVNGMAAIPLIDLAHSNTPATIDEVIRMRFDATGRALQPSDIKLEAAQRAARISCTVEAGSILTRTADRAYISLSFLPFPHGLSREVPEHAVLLTGEHMLRRAEVRLRTPGLAGWKSFTPSHIEKDGIGFDLSITEDVPGELLIRYTYQCPYVRIDHGHREAYNEVNDAIARELKRTLVYGTD